MSSKLFGKRKNTRAPTEERVMPIADDEAIKNAARANFIRKRGSQGRASTILTGLTAGGR